MDADVVRQRLSEGDDADRLDLLRHVGNGEVHLDGAASNALDDYLDDALDPATPMPIDERRAAIDAVVHVPHLASRHRLTDLADRGTLDERASAGMALARIGEIDPAMRALTGVLADETFGGPRDLVAEHLGLVAPLWLTADLVRLLADEDDPEVRFWLAAACANAGDPAPLEDELRTHQVPEHLRRLVRRPASQAGFGDSYPVQLRIQRVQPPQEMVGGEGPPVSSAPPEAVEVRGGGTEGGPGTEGAVPGVAPTPRPRYLEGKVPDRVRQGDTAGLQVRVSLAPESGSVAEALDLVVPDEGIDLVVTVDTPGFELGGPQLQPLHVPAADDSGWLLFQLRAVTTGVHDLVVNVFHPQGRQLGALTLQITVADDLPTTASRQLIGQMQASPGRDGEVSLLIDWLEEAGVYRFQLIDPSLPDEVLTEPLKQTPREVVEALVAQLNAFARNQGAPTTAARTWLRDKGVELWLGLIPKRLQQQFWERQDRITSLRIVARHDPVPWELLYPLAPEHDAGFLVEQFPVFRGMRGLQPVERIGGGPLATVVPATGAPTSADAEASLVRQLWAGRDGGDPVRDLSALRLLLERGEFGALHFACHNSFDPGAADQANVRFGTEVFTPSALAPMIAVGAFSSTRPLVFMNACRTAGEAPSYTALSGWATDFMHAGVAAFVGTAWEVRDVPAKRFAESFYRAALDGRTLGEAATAARTEIDDPADPTWLAYTLYGDPQATIRSEP
jgi:hypothetical protein